MVSYDGFVFANAVVDPAAVTDPSLLRRCFVDAFAAQARALRVADDGAKPLEARLQALVAAGL
jgi:hypothetical protein